MRKKRIVIIDDDKEFLEELKDMLEGGGYDTVAVNDSSTALNVVEQFRPDAVFLDLKMPKKSGYLVSGELSRSPAMAGIPIIAMSAYYTNGDFPLLHVQGIRKCVHKPFKPADIVWILEDIERVKTND